MLSGVSCIAVAAVRAVKRLNINRATSAAVLPAANKSSARRRNSAGYPFRAVNDLSRGL